MSSYSPPLPRAKKALGQHFLVDQNILGKIIAAIHPEENDLMVEIGPGPGTLTRLLLDKIENLHVVEYDRDMIRYLQENFDNSKLEIINCDVLKFDFNTLCDIDHKLRIVGNLPYNISTPIMFHLFDCLDIIKDMHFMLQKEVVDRMCAAPGSKDYGRLSVAAQIHCDMDALFHVPPNAFVPPPKVDSTVVRVVPTARHKEKLESTSILDRVLRAVFSQRRKTLKNGLKSLFDIEIIEQLDIDLRRRAETLSIDEFIDLANQVHRLQD